jgi:serine/threonine-protein kinase
LVTLLPAATLNDALETLGNYALLGRIAMGGMAEIFRARQIGDVGFEKDVVIKRILPQFLEDNDFIRMFHQEALLAAKLNHPNIVQVFDFKMIDGAYAMIMEFVEGVDLRRVDNFAQKAGKALGQNRAVQIALGMARGLGHAHERVVDGLALKIVHRDVSPHNVLISLAGDVKVMDFGIAKAAARAVRTGTGILKGKVSYMSPEQARGEELDHRTDIYATGVVLWEMLAGKRMVSGDNEIELLQRVQRGETPPISEVVPDVLPALTAVLGRMLAADREARPARMREVEKELSACLHLLGGPDAAPLDELVREVVPPEVIAALNQTGEAGKAGTRPLQTDPVTASTAALGPEQTRSERRNAPPEVVAGETRTGSGPRNVEGDKTQVATSTGPGPRPAEPKSRTPIVAGGLLVLGLAVALSWRFLGASPVEAPAHVIDISPAADAPVIAPPPMPVPVPVPPPIGGAVEVPPPAKPEPPKRGGPPSAHEPPPAPGKGELMDPFPGGAEAGKKPDKPRGQGKDKPEGRPPGVIVDPPPPKSRPSSTPMSSIDMQCPEGSVVYAGSTKLGEITFLNRHAFPVPAGRHTLVVRDAQGKVIGEGPLNVEADESDKFRCAQR